MSAVAGPGIVRWITDHARADRVQFDVSLARQQVLFVLHNARFETPFEQGAGSLVTIVEVPYIVSAQILHAMRNGICSSRRKKQVYVVGHEYPCVKGSAVSCRGLE